MLKVLGIDLGASGGKAFMGEFDGRRIQNLHEVHRFGNDPIQTRAGYFWDFFQLYKGAKEAIRKAGKVDTVAIDGFGNAVGFLDRQGKPTGPLRHHHDPQSRGIVAEMDKVYPVSEFQRRSLAALQEVNPPAKLFSMKYHRDPSFQNIETMLFIPEMIACFLCGAKFSEYSEASTSSTCDPYTRQWIPELYEAYGIPSSILPPIVEAGTCMGKVEDTDIRLIASATHDSSAAAAAMPCTDDDFIYLSNGSWSVMGADLPAPAIADNPWLYNEGGVCGRTQYVHTAAGGRLFKLLRENLGNPSLAELDAAAAGCRELGRSMFDVNIREYFSIPTDIKSAIEDYCRDSGQPVPETWGEYMTAINVSLALKYRQRFAEMEAVLGKRYDRIFVTGGGMHNKLLCQYTANATKKQVITCFDQSTAYGNLLFQLMGRGELKTLRDVRQVAIDSTQFTVYEPKETGKWDELYEKWEALPRPVRKEEGGT
ncbi:MAG TPA: FGGY family carbohydrate kinase [Candidatus Acidoferrum sp.]|nr:FGGY family carbohydrate kinase [Candidatus Acidoferrum sp.]